MDRNMINLTDEEMSELLKLTKDSDSVELKVSVQDDDHASAARSLGLDPIEAEIRQIYFFDTRDLALNTAGIAVRARRIQGGKADTVIKRRPVVPSEIPKDFRQSDSMKVEVDLLPGSYIVSASMKRQKPHSNTIPNCLNRISLATDDMKTFAMNVAWLLGSLAGLVIPTLSVVMFAAGHVTVLSRGSIAACVRL